MYITRVVHSYMSCVMRKSNFCICENKDADQLCSNCTADQHLCFNHTDSTISPLFKSEISSFYTSSVTAQTVCVRPGWKPWRLFFSHHGSYHYTSQELCIPTFQLLPVCHALLDHMTHLVGKPTMWFPNRSDTNQPVQAQESARSLEFRI